MSSPRAKRNQTPASRLTPRRIMFHTVGLVAIMAFGYLAARPPHSLVMQGLAGLVLVVVSIDVLAGVLSTNGWTTRSRQHDDDSRVS